VKLIVTCGFLLLASLPASAQRADDLPPVLQRQVASKQMPKKLSCELIRWAVRTFSKEYLEAKAVEHKVTKAQRAQAEACLRKK